MSTALLFSDGRNMPNYAPAAFSDYETMLTDTMSELLARWEGVSVQDFDAAPRTLVSLTRSGTTATATLTAHGFSAGDTIWIRNADGAADTEDDDGEYNCGGLPQPANTVTIDTVPTADTFTYTCDTTPTNATATGTPRVIWEAERWLSSTSVGMCYYGGYHSLMEYCDWVDGRGGSTTALRAARHLPLNGELARYRYGGFVTNGFARFPQVYSRALDEAESGVTITDMTNSRDEGAFTGLSSKLGVGETNQYCAHWEQWIREYSYLMEAFVHCEKQGEARNSPYLTVCTPRELVEGSATVIYKWLWEVYDAYDGPYTPTGSGFALFMMAINFMSLAHYYDHEVSLAADPDQHWPSTVMTEYSGSGAIPTTANPHTGILDALTKFAEWAFNRAGDSGDTTAVGNYRATYFRAQATGGGMTLGDPMVYEDAGLLKSWYRAWLTAGNDGTPLLAMWMPCMYWLAARLKDTDPVTGTWAIETGDSIMESMASTSPDHYPFIAATDGDAIKEGLQRIWYQFEGLGWRTEATGVPDAPV